MCFQHSLLALQVKSIIFLQTLRCLLLPAISRTWRSKKSPNKFWALDKKPRFRSKTWNSVWDGWGPKQKHSSLRFMKKQNKKKKNWQNKKKNLKIFFSCLTNKKIVHEELARTFLLWLMQFYLFWYNTVYLLLWLL